MGNMLATQPGKENYPLIIMESHLESIVNGGQFDSVLTALEVVQSIQDNGIQLDLNNNC